MFPFGLTTFNLYDVVGVKVVGAQEGSRSGPERRRIGVKISAARAEISFDGDVYLRLLSGRFCLVAELGVTGDSVCAESCVMNSSVCAESCVI